MALTSSLRSDVSRTLLDLLADRARLRRARARTWSGPLVNSRARFLWRRGLRLWRSRGRVVDDPEEIGVRRSSSLEPLVHLGRDPVELLPRTPSGESGIGRERRSAPPPPACRRGWRRPGDEAAGIEGDDWIDRERHQYRSSGEPPDPGLVPRPCGSPPKGPCSSYLRGPFNYFRVLRRRHNQVAPPPTDRPCWASHT
jgi:hypothetical protein